MRSRLNCDHLRSTVQTVLRRNKAPLQLACCALCKSHQASCNPPDIEDLGQFCVSRSFTAIATSSLAKKTIDTLDSVSDNATH